MSSVAEAYPRHARLTRAVITNKSLSKAARAILEALHYHLRVGVPMRLSNAKVAQWANVSEGTVSALMPVLAAEPGNKLGNSVAYITREWDATARRYVTTLLPPVEMRPRPTPPDPVPAPTPPSPPAAEVVILADQLSFFGAIEGSMIDPTPSEAPQPIEKPETGIKTGSIIDPPILIDHESMILSSSSMGTRAFLIEQRNIFPSLADQILAKHPDLTPEGFDDLTHMLARRGCYDRPQFVAAKILARGEMIQEPRYVEPQYQAPRPHVHAHQPRRSSARPKPDHQPSPAVRAWYHAEIERLEAECGIGAVSDVP